MGKKKKVIPTTADKIVTSLLNIELHAQDIDHQLVRLINLQKINSKILLNLAEVTNRNLVVNKEWGNDIKKEINNI